MTKKVIKLLDERTGLMECKICEDRHLANRKAGGRWKRGSWQCRHGCKID